MSGSAPSGIVTTLSAPFAANGSVESGPASGYWGDKGSGPTGMHIGCIRDRRLAVLITVRNRTKDTIRILGGGGPEPFPTVIDRVAVQVHLAPVPSEGVPSFGLQSWSDRNSPPAVIPPGRSASLQSNFLMRDCGLLRRGKSLTVNRSITLAYDVGGRRGSQAVAVTAARIILTRGPLHPKVPINTIG
jgi:hypothetical protein